MQSSPFYLDSAATTRVARPVAELASRLMLASANAGSRTHAYGVEAQRELSLARGRIAQVAGCTPREVVFTSGATEATNLALLGLAPFGVSSGRRHVVTTAVEHKATLEPLLRLERDGFEVTRVRPDRDGSVSADDVLDAVRDDTLLITVMHANNETGAINPIDAIAEGLRGSGPYLHVDAAQTFGKLGGGYRHPRVDMVSASGHKLFAPMGIGCLVVREARRIPLEPLLFGGGQERGLRAGTVAVALAAAFGLAAELAWGQRRERQAACASIRAQALEAFEALAPSVHGGVDVLPNILSLSFPGVDSEALMVALKDVVAISNGSACTSSSYAPSHVLQAMGMNEDEIDGTVRFSWSHDDREVPWSQVSARVAALAR